MTTSDETIFESTETMTEPCRAALRNLLIACADTKLLLGYHYGEWTFGAPELEAAVACCSQCQSELGHVRLLHGILNTHYGDDPDGLLELRSPQEFANIPYLDRGIQNWPELVAANYIVDLAVTTLLFSMKNSSFKPLHMSLEKMLDEEKYHIHHGQGWFRSLAQKSEETKSAISESARTALRAVAEWFGPENSGDDKALVEAGIKAAPNADIFTQYLSELAVLSETLKVDLDMENLNGASWRLKIDFDWKTWNPTSRRLEQVGPEDDILYHLRGSKNKVFKLGQ